jgi:cyclopropane fatty-acyl-phospholipid synthase-like methyltransferase
VNKAAKVFFSEPDLYITRNINIELRSRIVYQLLGAIANNRILDIGCGNGSLSMQYIAENYITFLDASKKMLDLAKTKLSDHLSCRAKMICSDFLEYNFDQEYDIILCIGVLAHVESVDAFINRITTLLKPNGLCIIQISDRSKLASKLFDGKIQKHGTCSYTVNYLTRALIRDALEKNGATILNEKYFWRPYGIFGLLPEILAKSLLVQINKRDMLSKTGSELYTVFKVQQN